MVSQPTRRIAIVLLRNELGEYFVHRRRGDKRTFPGLYGLGAGGSVERGEDAVAGAERELFEETGIAEKVIPLFEFAFVGGDVQHSVSVHELTTSEKPSHDASEWEWSGWLPEPRVEELRNNGELCPDTAEAYSRYRALKTTR
jgi:8-oxo-dGTP pyrophosphatase MutT (NUDIX family)